MLKQLAFQIALTTQLLATANPLTPGPVVAITTSNTVDNVVMVSGSATLGFMATYPQADTNLYAKISTNNGVTWTATATTITPSPVGTTHPIWVVAAGSDFIASWAALIPASVSTGAYVNVFSSGSWLTPTQLFATADDLAYPIAAVNGVAPNFMTTWTDGLTNNGHFSYSANTGTSWTTDGLITTSTPVTSATINAKNSEGFIATWRDGFNAYSNFSNNDGISWTLPSTITATADVTSDVWVSANEEGFMATWGNSSGFAQSAFSYNNGATWIHSPETIATDVISTSNVSVSGTASGFVAAWVDSAASDVYASFSSDNGASWSDPVLISGASPSGTGSPKTFVGVSAVDDGCMFTWLDQTGNAQSCFTTINPEASDRRKTNSTLFKQIYPNKLKNGLF